MHKEHVRCRNQGEESTTHQSLGSNADLPQEAEGETDHLPVTTFWGEAMSHMFGEQGKSTVLCESVCDTPKS
jgi:hypothetical protein